MPADRPVDSPAGALLALWNDVAADHDALYNDWHANEHVPERLTVPGMLWAARYACTAAALDTAHYLTLYGLRDADVLASEPYLRLLREPTAMSRRMRPALRKVSRWVCALRGQREVPDGESMALWLLADVGNDQAVALRDTVAQLPQVRGWLQAERLADADPLPWIAAGQQGGITGSALLCAAFDAAPPTGLLPANTLWYRRLPLRNNGRSRPTPEGAA